ncbi:MAG: fumarylacetoacetase [Flavobacteriaceae bacterium]|nr:fumarylacetoacetase [Flavobacteriaceae bacterium]
MINIPAHSDFSIHNLPFGIFSTKGSAPRVGVAIGEHVLDLKAVVDLGFLNISPEVVAQPSLNAFIALGKQTTKTVRQVLQQWLQQEDSLLYAHPNLFYLQKEVKMHLPVEVGDYTDFYSSIEHATNVGSMFRDPNNALLPNWKHLPVGYHGRASSIILSGTDIYRPKGQLLPEGAAQPVFQPTAKLDFELEMAFIVGKENPLGTTISTAQAEEYIFGMVLFNDWSARDLQKWEYVPLGPFLAKSFASSISPWVVPLEALEPFRVNGPKQEPAVLPYLQFEGKKNYAIELTVDLQTPDGITHPLVQSNYRYMYWNMVQQLAHHSSNGCNIRVGDMMASGTISGKTKNSFGSLLELSWGGKRPLKLKNGMERCFLEDGDRISMHAFAEKEGKRIGFGEVTTKIYPAL